jgi:hypothetical protein
MRSGLFRSFGLALAALVVPAAALAQSAGAEQIDQVRKDASAHFGPVYLTPTVALKEFGIDSNVFNAAGEAESDFTATLAPAARIWLPVARRVLLETTVGTDLVWYANFNSQRSIDPQVAGRAEIYLGRITLFGEAEYLNSRQRLNYEVDLRARHVQRNSTGGLSVRVTPKFSLEAAARLDDMRFDADQSFDGVSLQRTLNQQTAGYTVAARHRLTPLTTLVMRYERIEDAFAFSPERDSKSFRVMPGAEFKARALVKGSAYVGYREFTPSATGLLPKFSGLVAQLGLSYTLLGSTSFGVSYSRDLTYSYEELQPFFINNSAGVSVRRALGRRFDVLVSTDRHQYAYEDLLTQPALAGELAATVPASPAARRVDTTWNYGGSIGYRIGKGRVGFGASYWQRDSTQKSFRAYDNLRFGTTVTYGF